jgi:hypothetical protein
VTPLSGFPEPPEPELALLLELPQAATATAVIRAPATATDLRNDRAERPQRKIIRIRFLFY